MNSEEKREIILDNVSNPYNKEIKDDSYLKVNTTNDSCIDNITLFIKIEDDIIKEIFFDGEACAITTSTTSIMLKLLEGLSIDKALNIINNYKYMINEEEYDKTILKEANIYDEIYKQPNRKNCALLPWNGLYDVLSKYQPTKN